MQGFPERWPLSATECPTSMEVAAKRAGASPLSQDFFPPHFLRWHRRIRWPLVSSWAIRRCRRRFSSAILSLRAVQPTFSPAASRSKSKLHNKVVVISSCKARVLVIDDDPLVADTLAMVLKASGSAATAVYSGEKALELARLTSFDKVMTDVMMEPMNGIQAALGLSRTHPNCQVLLISGNERTAQLLKETADAVTSLKSSRSRFNPARFSVGFANNLRPSAPAPADSPNKTTINTPVIQWNLLTSGIALM